jgi:hypothetical protein
VAFNVMTVPHFFPDVIRDDWRLTYTDSVLVIGITMSAMLSVKCECKM